MNVFISYFSLIFCFCLACQNPPKEKKPNTLPTKVANTTPKNVWRDGDIIFHVSLSGQGKAIQLATHSDYTHCGIVFQQKGAWYVLEAIQPVSITPLQTWIARGDKGHYAVKRLKNAEEVLTKQVLQKMQTVGKTWVGKPYDLYFGWSDDKLYCSELVWKIYYIGAGIALAPHQKLQDFDLTSPEVKQKLQERYGQNIPYQEKVISPSQLFESALLEEIRIK